LAALSPWRISLTFFIDYPSLAHIAWNAPCWHGTVWDSHCESERS